MPSFNFKKQFAPKIRRNEKAGTIRSTQRCEPGDTMYLFTGLRTKQCKRIIKNGRTCLAVIKVIIGYSKLGMYIKLNGRKLNWHEMLVFAVLDGFPMMFSSDHSVGFFTFFDKQYGLPYTGYWHVWKQSALDTFGIKSQVK